MFGFLCPAYTTPRLYIGASDKTVKLAFKYEKHKLSSEVASNPKEYIKQCNPENESLFLWYKRLNRKLEYRFLVKKNAWESR